MEEAEKAGMTMEQWYAAEPEKERLYERFMCALPPGRPLPIKAFKDLGCETHLQCSRRQPSLPLQPAPPACVRQSWGRVGLGAVRCVAVGEVVICAMRPHLCP